MKKKKIGIYTIYSKHYSRVMYVGQSSDIDYRWKYGHKDKLKNRVHENHLIQEHYNRFENEDYIWAIVEECAIEELDKKEIYWEKFYDTYNPEKEEGKGFNLTWGATPPVKRGAEHPKPWLGKKRPDHSTRMKKHFAENPSAKERMSGKRSSQWGKKRPDLSAMNKKRTGEPGPFLNKKHTLKTIVKMSVSAKKRFVENPLSQKTRDKMSAAKMGENNPAKRPEVKAKLSATNKGENHPRSKLTNDQREIIIQLRVEDKKYWTHKRLGNEFGIHHSQVWNILKNWHTAVYLNPEECLPYKQEVGGSNPSAATEGESYA